MNEKLTQLNKTQFLTAPEFKHDLLKRISDGEIQCADDVVSHYGVTMDQAIMLLSDPSMIEMTRRLSIANTNLVFHTKVVKKVVNLLDSEDEKTVLSAAKMIGTISNNLKGNTGSDVNVNINLEQLVKNNKNIADEQLDEIFRDGAIDVK